jgi:diguanylate cyclase (GGDEF)-like protein
LPNRVALKDHLERTLASAGWRGRRPAVACIDLRRFKRINAVLGRAVGDRLLQEVARRLFIWMRPGDILARVGGGEFAVVFHDTEKSAQAVQCARRLLDAFSVPFHAHGHEVFLRASIGLSIFPDDGRDALSLLRNAAAAAFRAASSARQDVERFTPEIGASTFTHLQLEGDLWRALANGELRLQYLPQLDMEGRLDALEALLVWDHPRLGKISPTQFIPIAEECGMIVPIGEWVLRQACFQAAAWHKAGYPAVRVSVNVSAAEFSQPGFVATVAQSLSRARFPARQLTLELTESTIMREVEEAIKRMARLRALGVGIAIDDFGTGYSSLSYLRQFPVDVLKIDRSFLRDVESLSDTAPMVRTIIHLAHAMGLRVVAEGVETICQLEFLRAAGCDLVQGHLFGEPLPAEAVERLLLQERPTAAMAV